MFIATGDDKPLPYALLIMNFLEATGFITANGPINKSTKHWEISESSFPSVGEQVAPPPPPSPRPQPRRTQEPTLQSISDQISQLRFELHGYFDYVNYPYAALVPYQTAPDNVNDEEDNDD